MAFTLSNPSAKNRSVARFIAGALFLFASTGALYAQNVVVQGNSRVDTTTILSYVTGQSAEDAKRDLLATGLFSSVEVTSKGGQLIVKVRENNIINRVAFEGNKKFKSEVFEGELQLKPRGAFNQAALDADTAHIKEIYQRSGRSNVAVTSRVVPLQNGKIDVVFTIVEGEKTGVKSIEFVGNSAFSSGTLRDEMTTTLSNWLSWIKTTDVYDPDRLAADAESVRRYYLRHGYADMRVTDTKVEYDAEATGYRVVISVEEGKQYKVGTINVESKIAEIPSESLASRVRVSTGDIYNSDLIEKSILGITTEVASRGYAFSQVRPQGDRDAGAGVVNLSFVIEEGPRVYIERINIRGNTRTRDNVIRREFDVGEGDAYNKILIDRTERRLNNLGYFKTVRISNEPGSTPDRVIVNVDVEDQATGQFSIAGGYSTSEGVIFEAGVQETNLLGRGQDVRLKGSTGEYSKGVEFNYTEPYLFDQRISGGFDIYSKQSDNTRFARYSNVITGGTLRIGLPMTEEVTLGLRYSLYDNKITIPNTQSQPYNDCSVAVEGDSSSLQDPACYDNGEASLALKSAEGRNLTSLVGYTFAYNTVDNVRNPRDGVLAEAKQDFAGLGGDSRFIRTTADVKYYREITDNFVGLLRGQAGYVYGPDLRVIDNFFMGPNLVRGFASSGIGPRDSAHDVAGNGLGGTTYFGGSSELQFPIFGLPREAGLKGAIFADAGTVFGYTGSTTGITLVDDKSIRSSVGAGILWQSPIGPIRLDFAWPVTKNTYDQTQVFRFVGGTSF